MLFRELPDGDISHLNGIVELFFRQLHLKLILLHHVLLVHVGHLLAHDPDLLREIRIVQEVVEAEDSPLSLLLKGLPVGDDI
jgi:hypothetical protein